MNDQTPFAKHGKLNVRGTILCDSHEKPYQLKGVSTLGIVWYPQYINKAAFETIREWGGNLIRLAMYTQEEDGYLSGGDQEYQKGLIDAGVQAATELGMYVIIDWHILSDGNPNTHKEEAKQFFEEMTKKYAEYDNVLYEICNEPNGDVTWEDVKAFAEEVIPVIRRNAPEAVIIVGTPTWSQDVDIAAQSPLKGTNLMYACHFYAATHKQNLRDKVQTALDKGLPVFISEYSICDASGNGDIDYEEGEKWAAFMDERMLSYAQWNLANRNETSSMIRVESEAVSGWQKEDLTKTGLWLKERLKEEKTMLEVKFYDSVADELLKFAVIVAKSEGKWVLCKHRERDTLEVPGGHREYGETIEETAGRELQEETGAVSFTIRPVCVYSVCRKRQMGEAGEESFGMLYFAEITDFDEELHSEIERIELLDELPENWTYPLIQPKLIREAVRRGICTESV